MPSPPSAAGLSAIIGVDRVGPFRREWQRAILRGGVCHQLSWSVIGDRAAAFGVDNRYSLSLEQSFWHNQVCLVVVFASVRHDPWMLEQQQCWRHFGRCHAIVRLELQLVCLLVRHKSKLFCHKTAHNQSLLLECMGKRFEQYNLLEPANYKAITTPYETRDLRLDKWVLNH